MNIRPPTDIKVTQPSGGFWGGGWIKLQRTMHSSQDSRRQSSTSNISTWSTIAAWMLHRLRIVYDLSLKWSNLSFMFLTK